MKAIGLYRRGDDTPATFWCNDSCLLRPGRQFWLPEWDGEFRAFPMLALRIGRLGKGVAPRFATRYIDGVSLWLHVRAMERLRRLSAQGLPLAGAICFDSSLVTAEWAAQDCGGFLLRHSEGEERYLLDKEEAAEFLSTVSMDNTLRTGDVLLLPGGDEGLRLRRGDRYEITTIEKDGAVLGHCTIK